MSIVSQLDKEIMKSHLNSDEELSRNKIIRLNSREGPNFAQTALAYNPEKSLNSIIKVGIKREKIKRELENLGLGQTNVDVNQFNKIKRIVMPVKSIRKDSFSQSNKLRPIVSNRQVKPTATQPVRRVAPVSKIYTEDSYREKL